MTGDDGRWPRSLVARTVSIGAPTDGTPSTPSTPSSPSSTKLGSRWG